MNTSDDSNLTFDDDISDDAEPPSDHGVEARIIDVQISDTQTHLKIDRESLSRLVRESLTAESRYHAAIELAIVDNATIHALNRTHLNHDWPTDVVTFQYADEPMLQGELVVSAEMAVETAREANVDPWREFALYVVHGLLHLCGYDDKAEPARSAMRAREAEILALLGLTIAPSAVAPSPSESERYAS